MSKTAASYDNPSVIDLSDCTEVPYRESGLQFSDEHYPPTPTCRKCPSTLNSIGFALLIVSGILCALGAFCPLWIYYPLRAPVPELARFKVVYPFRGAAWRGLWAVCYKEVDLSPQIVESQWPAQCVWFGSDNDAWETIPSWYDAAEVLFTIGLVLAVLALLAESAFACCHCGLEKAWVPTVVASLVLGSGIMCTASLALFGDTSFQEGELTPEPTGQEGRLEWAFYVGIAGAAFMIFTSLLFYADAVRLMWVNRGSCR